MEDGLTGEGDASDEFVAADVVKVHDADVERALADLLPRHVEGERLVEDGLQRALERRRFALLHALVAEDQPHFHVRICPIVRTPLGSTSRSYRTFNE